MTDFFIIGGGSSLKDFDFKFLEGRNTIGVNDAFRLGATICDRVIFSDRKWFSGAYSDLFEYWEMGGIVCSLSNELAIKPVWIQQFERLDCGLSRNRSALGWNRNTGTSALNLALHMGAERVFLLGFDLARSSSGTHWHARRDTCEEVFQHHMNSFRLVHKHLRHWPGVQVLNVTDGSSRLPDFDRISFEGMFDLVLTLRPREVAA